MTDPPVSADQLVEQAHLAILRQDLGRARTLLKEALSLNPSHQEALGLLQSLPAQQSHQPRFSGESEHDFASRIAHQAGIEERARLEGDPWIPAASRPPISPMMSGPYAPYWKAARIAAYTLAGVAIVTVLPLSGAGRQLISTPSHYRAHLTLKQEILAGALIGFGFSFIPTGPPRRLRNRAGRDIR